MRGLVVMCHICFNEWHKSDAATYWEFYRSAHDSTPPWLEEAWHGDVPKGMARALIDGQLSLSSWTPYGSSWYHYPDGTPYARMFRHPRITGKWTTQETLSLLD